VDACLAALLDPRSRVQVVYGGRFHQRVPFASGSRSLAEHLLWFLLEGRAVGDFGGTHLVLRPGTLLWLPPRTAHDAVIEAGSSLVGLRLALGPSAARARAPLSLAGAWEARPLLEQIAAELETPRPLGAERVRALLAAVRCLLLRAPAKMRTGLLSERQCHALRSAAARQPVLGIGVLAAIVGLSRDYFARAFRASFGVSPRQWLLQERLRAARDLLERTPLTIKEVARAVGCRDANLFARQFRRAHGRSPRAHRREAAKGP
jgi:AraC-like DNA-binding protein